MRSFAFNPHNKLNVIRKKCSNMWIFYWKMNSNFDLIVRACLNFIQKKNYDQQ